MKKLLVLFVLLSSCAVLVNQSPDDRFTGTWEYEVLFTGYKSHKYGLVFDNTNMVKIEQYTNNYVYILDSEYRSDYYLWSVNGDQLILKECTIYGIVTGNEKTVSYQFVDANKMIFDGDEYLKK